jgi:hypothetical protein
MGSPHSKSILKVVYDRAFKRAPSLANAARTGSEPSAPISLSAAAKSSS